MQRIFVISDLHLGGKTGFQMTSEMGRARLAQFVRWATVQRTSERDVRLVLAGDIVDFLAEEPFSAFTADDGAARGKLASILDATIDVWDALHDHVASGAALTMMLGNHDIELSLAGPRRLLLERLGAGRVEFLYDNEAFTAGPVLVEHGNRYDPWNVVPHDALRRVRSASSRAEAPPAFPAMPGSELVVRVMNGLKAKYGFVDLLKPENEAMLPLVAALSPAAFTAFAPALGAFLKTLGKRLQRDADGLPTDAGNIGAPVDNDAASATAAMRDLARELASGGAATGEIGAPAGGEALPGWRRAALFRAVRAMTEAQRRTFDVGRESETYLAPARAAASRGFRLIVFGHTHLVKRVPLGGAIYLNSGTWADVIRIPEAVAGSDPAAARAELEAFAADMEQNQLEPWREQVPTFARIDAGPGDDATGDVLLFDGSAPRAIPDGYLARRAS